MYLKEKWSVADFSNAMENSARSMADKRFIRASNDKLIFNGFWRNGDKSNICIWLKKATWADAKTGEGGGCKDFAKIAFNLTLPEFMNRFGQSSHLPYFRTTKVTSKQTQHDQSLHDIWSKLLGTNKSHLKLAERWLSSERGFNSPREYIGSGFSILEKNDIALFNLQHHSFLNQRLSLGHQLVVPLRSVLSNKVVNLFFRALPNVDKNEKSRLLPGMGGWSESDGSPRGFGFPHLINDFSKLILCEGMADYFAAECLLECAGNYLAIGAANASALINWANWLSMTKYKGSVIILYQLDRDQTGTISSSSIGQSKASQTLKTLLENRISALLFKWPSFLKKTLAYEHAPNDIADICKVFGTKAISEHFVATLNEGN
jgi:hypothetical protein